MNDEAVSTESTSGGWRLSRATWLAVAVILVAVGLCYHGAIGNDFAYDDHDLVNGNDYLKGWMAGAPDPQGRPVPYVWRMLTADFATLAQRYGRETQDAPLNYFRPVIAVSYMIDTFFWASIPPWEGPPPGTEKMLEWSVIQPDGYHLTNVLFHALNSLLVFLLARSLFRRSRAGLAAAVIFAVHPMHTESVTWIAGRTDVIATTFFLGAFWGYVRFRRSGSRLALGSAFALFLVGVFAKEMVAILPLALAAWELSRLAAPQEGVSRFSGPGLLRAFGPVAVFAGLVIPYFLAKAAVAPPPPRYPVAPGSGPWDGVTFDTILITLPKAINWYLVKLLAPIRFNIYPMLSFVKASSIGSWLPWMIFHGVAVAGSIWMLVWGRRARQAAFLVVAGYLSLAPLTCLVPGLRLARFLVDIDFPVSERFLYVPSVFLALGVGLAALRLEWLGTRMGRFALGAVLVAVTVVSTLICADRNRDWKWNLALFRSAVEASPDSIRMRLNYGAALTADVWRVREGRLNFLRGVAVGEERGGQKSRPELHDSLGHSYALSREYDEAIRHFRLAWYQMGRLPDHGNRFAVTLSQFATVTDNPAWLDEAVRVFQVVLARAPDHELAPNSMRFCAATIGVWRDYHTKGATDDEVVRRYALSFLMPGESWAEEEDHKRRLLALQVLGAGLARLPAAEALAGLPRAAEVRARIVQLTDTLVRDLDRQIAALMTRFPGRAALAFIRADVNRIAGLRLGDANARGEAARLYREVLDAEPDHGEAALGLLELARAGSADPAAAQAACRRTVATLLDGSRRWEGRPLPTRPVKAVKIAERLATLDREGGPAFRRETLKRALDELAALVQTRLAGRDVDSRVELALMEVRASEVFGEPGRLARAADHLREAHRIAPRAAPILFHLVSILGRMGRHGEAREMRQRLEALGRRR